MDKIDDKKSNFDALSYCIENITSKPESYSIDTVRNFMLISIATSLADIADKMNSR